MMERRSPPRVSRRSWIRRYRVRLRSFLERDSHLGRPLVHAWRVARSRWRRLRLRYVARDEPGRGRLRRGGVVWLSPLSIERCSGQEFGLYDFRDAVVSGDWDLSPKRVQDLDIYQAMEEVLKARSRAWRDTPWYQRTLQRIESGEVPKGCRSEADLEGLTERIGRLFQSISDNGYQPQAALDPDTATGDEVAIGVGRGGRVLFCDGVHRLCAALLLGVDTIPAQVAVRHPEWVRFRADLHAYATEQGGQLYQPALHPDLAAVPSAHDCEDRWRLMESCLRGREGRVLDIGANLGYFDHQLEGLGFECTAVENDPVLVHFMKTIRDAGGLKFAVRSQNILVDSGVREERYAAVLALNILHHFLKTRQEYELLQKLLDEVVCHDMFFEPHRDDEPQMVGAYAPMTPEAFLSFVSAHTGLDHVELLGRASDGRSLFHLSHA
jgi:2-polyprenyl-3-methyl-5-hydroxy-6-metoxy-1,4-benzoquinol methylase